MCKIADGGCHANDDINLAYQMYWEFPCVTVSYTKPYLPGQTMEIGADITEDYVEAISCIRKTGMVDLFGC